MHCLSYGYNWQSARFMLGTFSYLVRLAIISLLCGAYKSTDQVNFCDREYCVTP